MTMSLKDEIGIFLGISCHFLPCQSPFLECLQSLPKDKAIASDILSAQSLETLKGHISFFHLIDSP